MNVAIGAKLSTLADPFAAGAAAAHEAGRALGGAPADLVIVFASGAHLAAPGALLEGIHDALAPAALIGCGAGGVLAGGHEHESGTAVAVWAASFGGRGAVHPFTARPTDAGVEVDGLPAGSSPTATIMLSDPQSFSAEAPLAALAELLPATPVLGGIASALTADESAALFIGDELCESGAVGVSLEGIEMIPCVSQGAAPVGRELTITAAHGNVITELAGRPALETVRSVIDELSPRELDLIGAGLLIGIVVDIRRPEYLQGDFLVRGVIGANHETGAVAVGAPVHAGQVVRLHARDAQSAQDDLRHALALRAGALEGRPPAGALVFSCNGRGRQMFGVSDHDARAVQQELGGAPTAGFFAAGEIGPVGGRNFVHALTATVGIFPAA